MASCASGSLGGIVNNTIAARRRPPNQSSTLSPSQRGWQHGIWADVFIGAVAGLITFLSGFEDVPLKKICLAAVFAGVSGATYFTKTAEVNEARRQAKTDKAKSQALKRVSDMALEPFTRGGASSGKSID
jgi:hypothetical protein